MTSNPVLEFRQVSRNDSEALALFFKVIKEAQYERVFHPHPLDGIQAQKICNYSGNDLYYLISNASQIIGYGMLRGWDEGFTIPSLGIAIHPSLKGKGIGRAFMYFLHAAASIRGASKVRLTVEKENLLAITFYQSLGYTLDMDQSGKLAGFINLEKT